MIRINTETPNSSFSLPASHKKYLNHEEAVKEQGHVVDRCTPKVYNTKTPLHINASLIAVLTWVHHKRISVKSTPQKYHSRRTPQKHLSKEYTTKIPQQKVRYKSTSAKGYTTKTPHEKGLPKKPPPYQKVH